MKRSKTATIIVGLAALSSSPSCGPSASVLPSTTRTWPGVTATAKLPEDQKLVAETLLVPITSSIATADNARRINLAATLTVRNADPSKSIVVDSIYYHDSGGKPIKPFLEGPVRIDPLASIDVFVGESDNSGGRSPSFLVDWSADAEVVAPIVEALMINTASSQGITLGSYGRVIASKHR